MKAIMGLIIAAIGVYIGVGLIPGMNTTISGITTALGYSSGVVGMVAVIAKNNVTSHSNMRCEIPSN